MKPFPQIQTQLFLLGLGLFSFISTSAQSQEFLTFTTREVKWVIESSEFWNNPKKYIVKDKNIKPPFDSENLDIYKTIYLDEGYHIGMVVKTSEIDSIECYIEGVAVDPFRREDRKYDGKHYVIDFTNVVKQHIFAVCEGEKLKIPEIRAKVKEIAPKYLSLGGELLIRIWSKGSNDSQFFRVLPEKYGFSLFNRALPVNAQYSGSSKDKEKLGNLVNLYYSLQIILKDHDKRGFNNWTTITKRISFGPCLLTTIDNGVSIKGGGFMFGIGFSGKGIPVIGGGIGFSEKTTPFFIYTINPIEAIRLLFNPREIFED